MQNEQVKATTSAPERKGPNGENVLLEVRDLKQYFPVKKTKLREE